MNDELRMSQTCCDCSTIVEVLNALRCWRCEGDWADMAPWDESPEQPEFVGDWEEAAEVQAWIWNDGASGGQRGDAGPAVVEVDPWDVACNCCGTRTNMVHPHLCVPCEASYRNFTLGVDDDPEYEIEPDAEVEVAPPTARPQRSIVPVIWQGDLEYAVRFDLAAARYLVIYRFLTGGPEGIQMWRDSEIQPTLAEQRDGAFPSTAAVALAIALQAEHLSELPDDVYCEVCGFSWPPDDQCRLH